MGIACILMTMIDLIQRNIIACHDLSNGHYMPECHSHLHYEFNLVTSRDSLAIVNNESYIELESPCFIVHRPFTLHCLNASPSAVYERYLLYFDQNAIAELPNTMYDTAMLELSDICVVPISPEREAESALVNRLRDIIMRLAACDSERTRSILLCGALDCADELIRTSDSPIRSGNSKNYINSVIKYIYNNLSGGITTEGLASRFYVSRAKLNRDFLALTSTTVKKYTTNLRIACAKRMLSEGRSIRDTSRFCGFNHESHFITVFKEYSKQTPGQFAHSNDIK